MANGLSRRRWLLSLLTPLGGSRPARLRPVAPVPPTRLPLRQVTTYAYDGVGRRIPSGYPDVGRLRTTLEDGAGWVLGLSDAELPRPTGSVQDDAAGEGGPLAPS